MKLVWATIGARPKIPCLDAILAAIACFGDRGLWAKGGGSFTAREADEASVVVVKDEYVPATLSPAKMHNRR